MAIDTQPGITEYGIDENGSPRLVAELREYLLSPVEPNLRLNPNWLAHRLNVSENELLSALAFAVSDGLVELHWETFCPKCGGFSTHFETLRKAHSKAECITCESDFEVQLDRDVHVTFSASEQVERLRDGESFAVPPEGNQFPPTNGLDLLLIPSFHQLFSGEAPPENESLRIGRITIFIYRFARLYRDVRRTRRPIGLSNGARPF